MTMGFTYYGDLLGIAGYYRLNPGVAWAKLNQFYSTTFHCLSGYCRSHPQVQMLMFSDSLLIYGDNARPILEELQEVYLRLIHQGILLRGGMVHGKLQFEPRFTLDNYQKDLPNDDTLARAVGLESTKKGARLLLDREIVSELLADCPDWLTHEDYVRNVDAHVDTEPIDSILRRIAPTPEQDHYECLYFWPCRRSQEDEAHYADKIAELETIQEALKQNIAEHYRETVALLKRCHKRESLTRARICR